MDHPEEGNGTREAFGRQISLRYFNHRIDEILATEVTDFALPEDVAVEELKW